jgi:hypothetical protein
MNRRPIFHWLEAMHAVKDNLGAFIFILTTFTTIISGGWILGAQWVDSRIALRTAPLQDIMVWQLTENGQLEKYLRHKAQSDSAGKALEIRQTSRELPPSSWGRSN